MFPKCGSLANHDDYVLLISMDKKYIEEINKPCLQLKIKDEICEK